MGLKTENFIAQTVLGKLILVYDFTSFLVGTVFLGVVKLSLRVIEPERVNSGVGPHSLLLAGPLLGQRGDVASFELELLVLVTLTFSSHSSGNHPVAHNTQP